MTLLALFGAVKNLLLFRSKNGKDVKNDLLVFSRLLGVMMVMFSILSTAKQFFGEPITCQPSHGALKPNLFSAYCFMNGTSTRIKKDRYEKIYNHESHIGITAHVDDEEYRDVSHTYYQWIPFIFFLQGVAFYLPYRMWKHNVGNKINKLLAKISEDPLTTTPIHDQVEDIAKFLTDKPLFFGKLAKLLFGVNFLALIQSVVQMYLLDIVFDGQYFGLGCNFYTIKNFWWEYRIILEEMFPMIVSCEMPYISTSGSVNVETGKCTLNMNILNQKLFIISWILHMIFIAFAILNILWNLFLLITPILRYFMLRYYRAGTVRAQVLTRVHEMGSYGQYVLISILAKNMEQEHFDELLTLVAEESYARKQMDEEFNSDSCSSSRSRLHPNFGGRKVQSHDNLLLPLSITDSVAALKRRH